MSPSRPLRIGLVAPPWLPVPPLAYGGTETVLDALARGLQAAGHEVVLFATGDSRCPVPVRSAIEEAPGIYVGGSPVEVHHVLASRRELTDVDVVHDHTAVGPLLALHNLSQPLVVTNHNPFSLPFSSVYRAVSEEVPVIAISEHHAASATAVKIAAVIHHGIDAATFPFGRGDGGYLLFVGRMSPEKGAHRAIAIARAAGLPLVLIGKQQSVVERAFFEEVVRPELGGGVDYLGEVAHEEKLKLLAGARALVNPIEWDEPFGMVIVEAFACGTPVLSFPRGAAPEIVEHEVTGFLAADEAGLVEACERIGEIDRERCRAVTTGHFSVARMVAEHVALYERTIDSFAGSSHG